MKKVGNLFYIYYQHALQQIGDIAYENYYNISQKIKDCKSKIKIKDFKFSKEIIELNELNNNEIYIFRIYKINKCFKINK